MNNQFALDSTLDYKEKHIEDDEYNNNYNNIINEDLSNISYITDDEYSIAYTSDNNCSNLFVELENEVNQHDSLFMIIMKE